MSGVSCATPVGGARQSKEMLMAKIFIKPPSDGCTIIIHSQRYSKANDGSTCLIQTLSLVCAAVRHPQTRKRPREYLGRSLFEPLPRSCLLRRLRSSVLPALLLLSPSFVGSWLTLRLRLGLLLW